MNHDEDTFSDLNRAPGQRSILHNILKLNQKYGQAPTVSEITSAMGNSADSNTADGLQKLEDKGYINRYRVGSRVQPRGTGLTERALSWFESTGIDTSGYSPLPFVDDRVFLVPVYSSLAAGQPRTVETGPIGRMALPAENLPVGVELNILQVKGDSMMGEDGILDGDQIVVVPYPDPKGDGEMVVATVDGGETVKRLWREGDSWRLQPSNPDFAPTVLQAEDEFYVSWRVVCVLRWHVKPGRR